MHKHGKLFEEYQLTSKLRLKNRIVMAPMTRVRADRDWNATLEMADYYARRADAGLIVTEGIVIRRDGTGYGGTPGLFTAKQIQSWKRVTDKVHEKGGHIFAQIWHVGRVSHPYFLEGSLPIAPSNVPMQGRIPRHNGLFYGKSRDVSLQEIQGLVQGFGRAAENAIQAGFDGIEIHGANGYLIDQFLHYDTNHRTDGYGGSPENNARFALEVVHACGQAVGFERVGLRLSPVGYLNEVLGDLRDAEVFIHLLKQLNSRNLAYIHTGNFNDALAFKELRGQTMTAFIRQNYQGSLIACGSYTAHQGEMGASKGDFDLVAFGRPFIANPDLISLLQQGKPLKSYDVSMLDTLI